MNKPSPLKVGITGGIGSGKTTVCKIFEILGIPVYYADDRAKWLMANDPSLKASIQTTFGPESYSAIGELNRQYLAEKVFSNPEAVSKINALVHPCVGKDFESWIDRQTFPYVLKEAALIFESGGDKKLDGVINVSSPLKVRVARVLLRDPHRSEEQINHIIDQQMPDEEKNDLADYVIKNTENKMLIPQVLAIHQELLKKSNS